MLLCNGWWDVLHDTPWKINMEPTSHPFRKKQMIFQTSMILFHVNLQGCKQDVVFLFGFAISTIIQLNPLMLTDLLIRSIRQAINTTVVDIIALNYNPLYSVIFTTLFFAHFFM